MPTEIYINNPIDGISQKNKNGLVTHYCSNNYNVRGYCTQSNTPFIFHIADITKCLIRDRLRTLQFLNEDPSMYGFNWTSWKAAVQASSRHFFDGEKTVRTKTQEKENNPRSSALKTFFKQLTQVDTTLTESEVKVIYGPLWDEYLDHQYYEPLYTRLFETTVSDSVPLKVVEKPQAHEHEDGTFCLTVEQYDAAKQMDLLRWMSQSPKIVMQRAASN